MLAPYVKRDALTYEEVYQGVQQFVFNLNVPSRWGMQTPFTNITLDWVAPDDLKEKKPIIAGEEQAFTYADCQPEMDLINKAFIEIMTKGDRKGRVFTFPIPTYNITKDFKWETENAKLLFEMTAKYGIPYFQNFMNSSLNPSDVRSMCCRLQLDLRVLRARGGGLFGSAEMTGSVGVVTINLPRIAYLAQTKQAFFDRLARLMDIAKSSLEIKRKVVQENIDRGLLPYTKRYLPSLRNHFSTIGLNGMNEACLNLLGVNLGTEQGKAFAHEVLGFMRDRLLAYQDETGNLYNLEATPAEGVTYRFAKEDKARYPNIIQAGTPDAPYYTNSTHLPVGYTDDPLSALDHQDDLQTKYTGGTVLHLFLGERVRDWRRSGTFC
jgi:ribonucleoside-triphosphate reductase